MKKRTVAAVVLFCVVASVLAATAGAGAWLLYTESGLRWLVAQLAGYGGQHLTLEGVYGTLAGGARVQRIRFAGKDIEVQVRDAGLSVHPLSVLLLRPRVRGLTAAELAVTTRPGEPRGKPPDTLALPIDLELREAHVARLTVDLGKGPLDIDNVRLDYSGGKSRHSIESLSFSARGLAVELRGTVAAQPPFPLTASFTAVKPQDPQVKVKGSAGGNLSALTVEASAHGGDSVAAASATVRPYDAVPIVVATAQIGALDLHAWSSNWPRTSIDGRVELKRSGDVLAGPVELTNALPGRYDSNRLPLATLRARLRTDLKRVSFDSLAADLGTAGAIAGYGQLNAGAAEFTLTTKNLNLAAIHEKLRATRLAGRAKITFEETGQRATADLKEGGLGLSVTASRTGDAIDVPLFEARARGGVARGSARLSTAQLQPFTLQATFARFDPAAWGDFPRGSINGELTATGGLAGPTADIGFTLRDSRWLGAPLTGHGRLSIAAERVRNADIALKVGDNRISAEGALGGPRDALSVRFDAPQLALVDREISGRLHGTARVSGDLRAPRLRFEASGAGLKHERYGSVKTLQASGVVGTQAHDPIEVRLQARGISAAQGDLASATMRIEGTGGAHTALLEAHGERIDFRAQARGGWHQVGGWSGVVQEFVNRGEVPIELTAPVSVVIGPGRVRVDPMTLRAMGGQFTISELAYEGRRLTSSGRFSNFPVKPIVALTGGPAAIAGTLKLSGHWSVRNTPGLAGSVTVTRESGDVAIGPQFRSGIGLETLAVEAQLAEREIRFAARIRSALASATAQGVVKPASSAGQARYGSASPIEFTAQADVARLEPFAAFFETPMLIRGQARAQLRGTGTVSDPVITGPVTADGLAAALPAEGIELSGGTLRAMLAAREIRIESFSIRGGEGVLSARGTLARAGLDHASLAWQAERFRVLARPDRNLVVTGSGNAALKAGKLSFTGKLHANEGEFDIGETRLPALGSDVVVVGRTKPQAPQTRRTSTLSGVSVDLSIDLGNKVEVRGEGLQVWLSGSVHVYTGARGEVLARGTVNARNGTYIAYGQRLVIDRGHLYFDGPISNPGLDIVAMRKRQAVEAGVAISGTLRNPLVRVVSDPQVPEAEALTWLVLGRGPAEATAGELSALPLATSALLGKAAGPFAKSIGVDELGLRGGGSIAEQFLTVGKRISDRMYLYFERSLGGAENLLRLEFALTQRIALRAQAGTTGSLGVFYNFRWD